MVTISEAQLLGWLNPLLWPLLRVAALFTALPVLGQRGGVPVRVRVAFALLVVVCAQPSLPPMPVIAPDSAAAFGAVVQQLVVGLALGFAVRIVFAAVEFAGELVGLQMGLNYASFFDPASGGQLTAVSRFYGTTVAFVFIVVNGHLLVVDAVVRSFRAFPLGDDPLAFVARTLPHRWGAEIFALGLWIALPMIAMLLFVNLVLGVVSRVASQMNIYAIGFPLTLGVGLVGLALTLPLLQAPFVAALQRMLALFG